MIPPLYKAIMEGQIEILNQCLDDFEGQLTGNNNTVLHVAAQFGKLECAQKILQLCPSLIYTVNCKRETPLHVAASAGNFGIVGALIERAKEFESEGQTTTHELLRAINLDEDTALHMAVQNEHLEVVKLLTSEDREFTHPANKAEETPLYLAVERQNFNMVVAILRNCSSPLYSGPDGRTALHEAALIMGSPEIAGELLEWKPELIDKPDAHGWTPLHYAVRRGNAQLATTILETDYLLANIRTGEEDGGKTALHIAAAIGNIVVMKVILSKCPECWEAVDYTGRNILHIAAYMEKSWVIKFIFNMSWSSHLINQKDNKGNTPFHLLVLSDPENRASLRKYDTYWFAFNKQNMSPVELVMPQVGIQVGKSRYGHIISGRNIFRNDQDNLAKWKITRSIRLEKREKARQDSGEYFKVANEMGKTHMIVATLIATITFAASFTIPGGYDPDGSEQGTAILVRKAAFKAFVIANTIAVLCSTSSVLLYTTASGYLDETRKFKRYTVAFSFIVIATVAMMVAFVAGTYSMLSHSLGVPVAVIGCIFFLTCSQELFLYLRKISLIEWIEMPTKEGLSGLWLGLWILAGLGRRVLGRCWSCVFSHG